MTIDVTSLVIGIVLGHLMLFTIGFFMAGDK